MGLPDAEGQRQSSSKWKRGSSERRRLHCHQSYLPDKMLLFSKLKSLSSVQYKIFQQILKF